MRRSWSRPNALIAANRVRRAWQPVTAGEFGDAAHVAIDLLPYQHQRSIATLELLPTASREHRDDVRHLGDVRHEGQHHRAWHLDHARSLSGAELHRPRSAGEERNFGPELGGSQRSGHQTLAGECVDDLDFAPRYWLWGRSLGCGKRAESGRQEKTSLTVSRSVYSRAPEMRPSRIV